MQLILYKTWYIWYSFTVFKLCSSLFFLCVPCTGKSQLSGIQAHYSSSHSNLLLSIYCDFFFISVMFCSSRICLLPFKICFFEDILILFMCGFSQFALDLYGLIWFFAQNKIDLFLPLKKKRIILFTSTLIHYSGSFS